MHSTEDAAARKFVFGLRGLFVAVTFVGCVLYLLVAAPDVVAMPVLLVMSAAVPAVLAVGILYDRPSRRAFYAGALVPATGLHFGLVFISAFFVLNATPINFSSQLLDEYREFLGILAPAMRLACAVFWVFSVAVGLIAEVARRLFQQSDRRAGRAA